MDKFFTKKESEIICSLLSSKDEDNIKMGMNLITTHSRFKNIKKCIIMRYPKEWIKGYYNISPKQSFGLYYKIYLGWLNGDIHVHPESMLYSSIIKFIQKRTFKNK